jgi:hypothetical protein
LTFGTCRRTCQFNSYRPLPLTMVGSVTTKNKTRALL